MSKKDLNLIDTELMEERWA